MLEPASTNNRAHRDAKQSASSVLITAALTGLLGASALAACGDDHEHQGDSTGSAAAAGSGGAGGAGGADAAYNNPINEDAGTMTRQEFEALCEERGGYAYVNAACAGSSMCKGLSLHEGVIWEHSCRGQNSTCSGIGCLDLPEDPGTPGKELYETFECGTCHADYSQTVDWDNPIADYTKYAVFFNPEERTLAEAKDRFKASTDKRLEAIVVWGTQGIYDDNTPYSNMPTYYQKLSLGEIRRVVAHIKTLCPFGYPYGVFGQDTPDGGHGLEPEPIDVACP